MTAEFTDSLNPIPAPEGGERGFTHEYILLTVRIAHTRSISQFDDTCAYQLEKVLQEYNGVFDCDVTVHYRHNSEQTHVAGCGCGDCTKTRKFPFGRINTNVPESLSTP